MYQETVYGTHEDNRVVMSEKVKPLAESIYQELERMIARYGEDVVKGLMPLLVNVLESLDIAYTENQAHEVELELLRDDNEQLVAQYEREKQLRKASDQKLLEHEHFAEDKRNELLSKIDSLESKLKMLELKAKNSHDHVVRLEEREAELKREYSLLHDRYTELLKSSERLKNSTNNRGYADALGEMDEGADITGSWAHPGEYASSVNDTFDGIGKEVENLIMENNELLATKDALNILKDDLIAKVDELTSKQKILRDQVRAHQQARKRLRQKVATLEEELKNVREEAEAKATKSDDEQDVPFAQRKRFTRVEMARVLIERNQCKERLMELQETVRWAEMIRAIKTDPASIYDGNQSD